MSKRKIALIITLILVVIAGLGTGGFMCVYSKTQEFDRVFMEGVYIEETNIGGLSKEEAKSKLSTVLKTKEEAKSILLYGGDKEWDIPYTKFKATYNVDKVLEKAFEVGHQGNMIQRFRAFTSKDIKDIVFTVERSYNEAVATEILKEYKEAFYKAPQDATMVRKDKRFIITPEQAGQELNIQATADELNRVYQAEEEGRVGVVISPIDPKISASYYDDVQSPIASFYTTFTNRDLDRNVNLEVGAATINTSVGPGQVFALSEHFGNISAENGYRNSKVIINGKLVDGIGGGICQVASTLYNSVLLTDLEIISRQNHSLPVGYIPLGRDATYASGVIDFKFKNPTEHPAYVESYVENNRLYVNIFGHQSLKPDHDIKFESVLEEVIPAPEPKYEDDPTLEIGKEVVQLAGLDGKKVNLYKYIYKDGKLIDKVLENKSYYRPRAGIISRGTKEPEAVPEDLPEPKEEEPNEVIDDPGLMNLYEEQA